MQIKLIKGILWFQGLSMKLNQLTIQQALKGLRQKKFSSVELTKACLDRIEQTNSKLNSFLTLNPNALTEAKKADQLIKTSVGNFKKYQILGIPYGLKDNFLTEGLRTTASAKLLDEYLPQYNSTVYQRLKDAGAVLLGKTNMDAWAHGSSTETSDYGPTRNPWNLDYLPGGSSGGSAAAVLSDQCIFSIGSETAGSIRQPSAWCGVTGFKPTYGRVSRYGVIAMASSTDSPGPIAKNVYDTAIILKVIAGHDHKDATSSPNPVNLDLGTILKTKDLSKLKIALPNEYLMSGMNSSVIKLIKEAANVFTNLGAKVESASLIDPKYAISVYTIIQRAEVASNLSRYDGIRFGHDRTHFSNQAKNRSILGTYALSRYYHQDGEYYIKSQKVRNLIVKDFKKLFNKFDLFIAPTSPGPAQKVGAGLDNPMFGELEDKLVEACAVAGLAGISVPCGYVNNLPIGLQISGPQFSEQKVLEASQVYQAATSYHLQKPKL